MGCCWIARQLPAQPSQKNAILRVGNELCVFIGNDRQVFSGPTVSASRSIGVQRFSGCNKLMEMMCNTPISFLHRLGV